MSRKEKLKAAAAAASALTPAAGRELDAPPQGIELADAEVAARAYSFWENRGYEGGTPEDDWQRAIRELTEERAAGGKP